MISFGAPGGEDRFSFHRQAVGIAGGLTRIVKRGLLRLLAVLLVACASGPLGFDNDSLSELISVTNVQKAPIADPSDPSRFSGVIVTATIINSGFVTIDVPFLMRWSLLREGAILATATQTMPAGFRPGANRLARLTITFGSLETLSGLQDAVTFDVIEPG